MTGKTDRFIVSPQPVVEELVYHNMAQIRRVPGTHNTFMDSSLVREADILLHVREVKEVPSALEFDAEPHKHDVSQLYGIIGELTLEVILDGERHEVKGPACVFIPAGTTHTLRLLKGNGYLLAILRKGKYD